MKTTRQSGLDIIKANQSQPIVNAVDVQNVVAAARMALGQLRGSDLINVSTSISNIEASFAPKPNETSPTEQQKPTEVPNKVT